VASANDPADALIAEGNRAEDSGRLRDACELYRKAVAACPGYARAHLNLGIALDAAGDPDGALRSYEAALSIDPGDPYANYNFGKLLHARGSLQDAGRHLRAALERKSDFFEARIVLADAYDAGGNSAAAAAELELALKQRTDHPGALYNYGVVLRKLGRLADAESAIRRALDADPRNPRSQYELGVLLYARGALAEAESALREALLGEPRFPEAHAALYEIYRKQDRIEAALAELEHALAQRPDWVDAHFNRGVLLRRLGKGAESELSFRRVIALDPEHIPAYRMLGSALLGQSRVEEAIELYGAIRSRHCDRFDLESAELFALNFSEDVSDSDLFERHKAFGARLEATHSPRFAVFPNAKDPERRLRVGYVSGDFCHHPVALFTIPLFERHDRSAYEVYCYSTGDKEDDFTRQISTRVEHWQNARDMSVADLADAIHRDRIDILVDLAGHSGVPALGMFALQPAPVQVTWLGYLNTTGMTRIHYRLCDRHSDPPGASERFHTESLIRLPHSQWCYRPWMAIDPSGAAPIARNGFATFGSFNQSAKLSRSVRSLWADILARVPRSRFVAVGVPDGRAREDLLRGFERSGVDPARVTVVPYVAPKEYFDWLGRVDIALDTTPYSGGTTTCDALWMGVPVITVSGSRSASRSTASILSTIGLARWIAATPQEYVRLAGELAGSPATIAELRKSLRGRMRQSPLMDEPRFVHAVEQAYRQMWRTWCGASS
jgi:protein O-GlcNAc transferase